LAAILCGAAYFIFNQGLVSLGILLLLTLATRFRPGTRDFGKFVEILFLFLLISFIINDLGIAYPYSLIIVLTGLVVLIFYEGPEWARLFFAPGQTAALFKQALVIAGLFVVLFGVWIYYRAPSINNPVPTDWPFDAIIIVGLGFSFYKAVVEEMIFRSFIYQRAQTAAGGIMAIPIQGVFYGLMQHRVGVPAGVEGVVLGSALGMALAYLVHRTGSVYLAMFVQFLVTLGIFCTLAFIG
jgi:membrane protease YdiL (CAAX protease family)